MRLPIVLLAVVLLVLHLSFVACKVITDRGSKRREEKKARWSEGIGKWKKDR